MKNNNNRGSQRTLVDGVPSRNNATDINGVAQLQGMVKYKVLLSTSVYLNLYIFQSYHFFICFDLLRVQLATYLYVCIPQDIEAFSVIFF